MGPKQIVKAIGDSSERRPIQDGTGWNLSQDGPFKCPPDRVERRTQGRDSRRDGNFSLSRNRQLNTNTKMQTALTESKPLFQPRASALAVMAGRFNVEPDKLLGTLKNTVFKGASNDELLALVVVANEYGLNPLTKEIYAFPAKGAALSRSSPSMAGTTLLTPTRKWTGWSLSSSMTTKASLFPAPASSGARIATGQSR